MIKVNNKHCVKSVCIRSFSGPYFPAFGLNTDIYGVNLRVQSKCGKMQTRKTSNTDTFRAVKDSRATYKDFTFFTAELQ